MKQLTHDKLYDMRSMSQPTYLRSRLFATKNQMNRELNTYNPQVVKFNGDLTKVSEINPQLFASRNAQATKDYLYYAGQPRNNAPFYLYQFDEEQKSTQVAAFPIQELATATLTNRVFFITLESDETPITIDSFHPEIRHITREKYAADGFGFIPNDGQYKLYEYDGDTKTQRLLYSSKTSFTLCDADSTGTQLALRLANFPESETDYSTGISLFNTQTGELDNLTSDHTDWLFNAATFSPDGSKLLFNVQDILTMAYTNEEVYEFNLSTRQLTAISKPLDEDLHDVFLSDNIINPSHRNFAWVNNSEFYFLTNVHGHSKFYRYDGAHYHLHFEANIRVCDWTLSDNGELITCYTSGTKPSIVGIIDKNGQLSDRFNINEAFDTTYRFSTPEKFFYTASDGQSLEGWLIEPTNQPKSGKSPLFLYIHGGPHDAWSDSFYFEMQVLANAGYGVVLPNPRGSSSYGLEFIKADQGKYGEKDYTDLLEAMDDVLKNHPEFDSDQQYVGGCSFGGFMSAWMVGHTDRFKAAIVQNPVTDFISMVGISDEGIPFVEEDLLTKTDDINRLWHFSPLAYAKNVTTPTLIIGSEWDKRCPISQSEEYYSALKHQHVETELSRFPQSWHTIMYWGKPNLRIKWMSETQRWMDEH